MDNKEDKMNLLQVLAKSMNCSVAYWKNVDDIIERDIIISRVVDTKSYINVYEDKKLMEKSWIGK
ncbi:MAG: hypothetical protein SOT71_13700 [Romboutsia timonensis]|uniref:hypothetical protein n=1 Tax=Romboutsia timonensis TaxID=1776391 RepID=UPI002A74B057|nr:hypothetical protein [Romboutsia timonensis]MDY2883699.1 hypothetical protein [Romboutsia timonensis]